jgi:hypothetical protein
MSEAESSGAMPNPQTPDGSSSSTMNKTKKTPRSAPAKGSVMNHRGDGLSMYERTKLQIQERERKLKALQETLMADCTFTPRSAANSVSSSLTPSSPNPEKVFDRLYSTETAAMRARKASTPRSTRSATNSPFSTPSRSRVRSAKDGYITPGRLEALHSEGQNKLRARKRTAKVSELSLVDRMKLEGLTNITTLHYFLVFRRRRTKIAKGGKRKRNLQHAVLLPTPNGN